MKRLFFILLVLLACAAGLVAYLVMSERGSKIVVDQVIATQIEPESFHYQSVEGDLIEGMVFKNIVMSQHDLLPEGSILRVQRLALRLTSLSVNGLVADIENARIDLPLSEPIVLRGTMQNGQLDFNIYSNALAAGEILDLIPNVDFPVQGELANVDLYATGSYLNPEIRGKALVQNAEYKKFKMFDVPLRLDLQIKDMRKDKKLIGEILMLGGEFHTERIVVNLNKSRFRFSELWPQPRFHIQGKSKVEKTLISIDVKGTKDDPEISVSSQPPHSRQKLLIMLATGKSWSGVEASIENGVNSVAIARDFIDYIFFPGQSTSFAERFGLEEFSVKFDKDTRGVAAKKGITDKIGVGYGIEKTTIDETQSNIKHTIEGEVKVTEDISVGLEREVTQREPARQNIDEQTQTDTEDRIMIEYKKSF